MKFEVVKFKCELFGYYIYEIYVYNVYKILKIFEFRIIFTDFKIVINNLSFNFFFSFFSYSNLFILKNLFIFINNIYNLFIY